MKSLYESILSTDEESQDNVLEKINVKESLIDFLHYLHIDNLNNENDFKTVFTPNKDNYRFEFNLKNYIDYITSIHHGSEQWYLEYSYETMYINCQNFIKDALKEFEKSLDTRHVKYKKTGREFFTYELLDTRILFIIYKLLETGIRKRYDKNTKGSLELRHSMKNRNWWFEFEVSKEIWNL